MKKEITAARISAKLQCVITRGRGWAFALTWLRKNRDAVRLHFSELGVTEEAKIVDLGLLVNLAEAATAPNNLKTVDRF